MSNITNASVDKPRGHYERLRAVYLDVGYHESIQTEHRFTNFGFYGLFQLQQIQAYKVEVYQAPGPRWHGKKEPTQDILRDAYMQIVSLGSHAGNN